jgi:hypothetical protein
MTRVDRVPESTRALRKIEPLGAIAEPVKPAATTTGVTMLGATTAAWPRSSSSVIDVVLAAALTADVAAAALAGSRASSVQQERAVTTRTLPASQELERSSAEQGSDKGGL